MSHPQLHSTLHIPRSLILILILAIPLFFVGAEFARQWYHANSAGSDPLLKERTVVSSEIVGSDVRYTYLGEKLPEKLAEGEVLRLRTETSFSREVHRTKEEITREQVSYPQQVFARDAFGVWYYAEHATTTREAFLKKSAFRYAGVLARAFFVNVAYAVTDTVFSHTGDGSITSVDINFGTGPIVQNAVWNAAHDATTGDSTSSTGTAILVRSDLSDDSEITEADINRAFVPFDTSSIPSSAVISSASLNIFVTAKTNVDNDTLDFITVVRTDNADYTNLVNPDFNNAGAVTNPTEGVDTGQRKDITSITTSAYLVFTLNATGRGWIAKSGEASNCSTASGISCFGLREGHDALNSQIVSNFGGGNSITFSSAEATGTANDPFLSVTYTVPNLFAPWMFEPF